MTVMIRLLRPIMDGLIAIATTDKNKMIKITYARPSNLDLQNCSRIIPDVASLSLNVVQFSVCELTVGSGTGRTYRRTNGRMGGWGITLDGHVFLQLLFAGEVRTHKHTLENISTLQPCRSQR